MLLSIRGIFIIGVLAVAYIMYVSPWVNTMKTFKNDTQLNGHLGIVMLGKTFDTHSYNKALHHLRRYFYYYSQSFNTNVDINTKLKHHHYSCMKYLRRIPFRLHNDENLKHGINQAIDNINIIIENYTYECHDRNNKHYFGQYG